MQIVFVKTDQRHQQLHSMRKTGSIELDWQVIKQITVTATTPWRGKSEARIITIHCTKCQFLRKNYEIYIDTGFWPIPVKHKRSQEKPSLGCKWGEQMSSLADRYLKAAIISMFR